jgi:LPPG:FO 2-phospho-L-lactate transferase
VISIGPIVSMPALREAVVRADAPVVAVSPYVAGQVVKGPTDIFMRALGRPSTAAGVASLYEGLLEGMICDADDPDPPPQGVRVMSCPTLMEGPEGRRELARRTLEFASTLAERG